ncbi:hypothetical protein ACFQ0M_46165 [Kitasatospora aburaviensis]
MTSRIDEYEVASRDTGSALPGTAALLLQVLPFEEAARYLRHSSGTATVSVWNPVLARLAGPRPDPQARAVRGALSTPWESPSPGPPTATPDAIPPNCWTPAVP